MPERFTRASIGLSCEIAWGECDAKAAAKSLEEDFEGAAKLPLTEVELQATTL